MHGPVSSATRAADPAELAAPADGDRSARTFHQDFVQLFDTGFAHLFRFLDRLSGDPDLAADLAQETYVRLYRRRTLPDAPGAWLISVALNLLRNAETTARRRRRLLSVTRAEWAHADPGQSPDTQLAADETRQAVRRVLDGMTERERHLLLLSAEGFSYRDMALALQLNESSVGTLLARARQVFRQHYRSGHDAS